MAPSTLTTAHRGRPAQVAHRTVKIFRNAYLDLQYGRPLAGKVETRYPHLGASPSVNANYDDLPILFEAGEIQPEDVIVDVGAGKGRAINWLLSHHPRNRIIGIELDPQICSRAAHRLRNYPQVTIVCGDAIKLLPAEGTIFYMFNPFNEEVMIRFRDALLSARAGRTGRTRLIYYNAESLSVFSSHPRFQASMIDSPSPSLPSASIDLVEEDSR